jgi:hypothetical protein
MLSRSVITAVVCVPALAVAEPGPAGIGYGIAGAEVAAVGAIAIHEYTASSPGHGIGLAVNFLPAVVGIAAGVVGETMDLDARWPLGFHGAVVAGLSLFAIGASFDGRDEYNGVKVGPAAIALGTLGAAGGAYLCATRIDNFNEAIAVATAPRVTRYSQVDAVPRSGPRPAAWDPRARARAAESSIGTSSSSLGETFAGARGIGGGTVFLRARPPFGGSGSAAGCAARGASSVDSATAGCSAGGTSIDGSDVVSSALTRATAAASSVAAALFSSGGLGLLPSRSSSSGSKSDGSISCAAATASSIRRKLDRRYEPLSGAWISSSPTTS